MGKKYSNNNGLLIVKMIEIYKPVDFDWMSYRITKNNKLTFHHIVEESKGGLSIIDNGALITKAGHQLLNKIYSIDKMLYDDWNELFRIINASKETPTEEMMEESKILKKFSQSLVYRKNM